MPKLLRLRLRLRQAFTTATVALFGLAGLLASAPCRAAATPQALASQAGCAACHLPDKKLIGPSYREVAARYKGQADAAARLAGAIRKGSTGVWGPVPMPATPAAKLGDADLKAVVAWVLKAP
jgi:cytochrome c